MEAVIHYLLLALALTSVQISYTESRLNEKRRDKNERRLHSPISKDNICEITNRESKVHCYCENTEIKMATRADCWIFNGGIEENDSIWATFNTQPHIEKLTFNVRSDGALKFIPLSVIHRMKRLQKLYIHYATLNKIEKRTFTNMSTLTDITLMNNKITELDFSSFTNLPELVNLTIKENKVTEIQRDVFVDLPNLKYLDLSFNSINLAHDGCFIHLTMLNDLILEANQITVLTRDTFRGLNNLTRLDLRSNKLSMIGDLTFTELWNLNELLLDNNELKFLAERAFDGLVLLQKLSLTGNKLQSINEGLLKGVPDLDLLDLRNNELEALTYETVQPILETLRKKQSVLYLSGNNFICDCDLAWMKVLRNETTSEPLRTALDDVTCMLTQNTETTPSNKDDKNGNSFEINSVSDANVFQQDENVYANGNVENKEPTAQSVTSHEVTLVDIPADTLPCRKQAVEEDSLMLFSKIESYWRPNSCYRVLSNLSITLHLGILSILSSLLV